MLWKQRRHKVVKHAIPQLQTTYLFTTNTKRPTSHRDVSVRLIFIRIESGSFSCENKRRISNFSDHSKPSGTEQCHWKIYINMLVRDGWHRRAWLHSVLFAYFLHVPQGVKNEKSGCPRCWRNRRFGKFPTHALYVSCCRIVHVYYRRTRS